MKDAAEKQKQQLEREMEQQQAAAAASEAALREQMEGEMAKQKAKGEADLIKIVQEWQQKVTCCLFTMKISKPARIHCL